MHIFLSAPPPMPYHLQYFQHFQGMEDNPIIWVFVWAIIIDIITGFAKSILSHHATSNKGTDGLIKHGVILLIMLTLYPMLDMNGMREAANTFVFFYILNYGLSILENLGQMGVPFPKEAEKYIYKLSDDYKKEHSNEHEKHNHSD